MLNVMASVAQWERETIGERTADALAHLRDNGRRVSHFAPFGYRHVEHGVRADGKTLWRMVEDEAEQAAIEAMRRLRAGGMSLTRIGAELETRGHVGRNGQRLSAKVIRDVLRRHDRAGAA